MELFKVLDEVSALLPATHQELDNLKGGKPINGDIVATGLRTIANTIDDMYVLGLPPTTMRHQLAYAMALCIAALEDLDEIPPSP